MRGSPQRSAYLGHLITPEGVNPKPSKVYYFLNFPQLQHQKDIKSFFGLAGNYKRIIANFSKMSRPLTKLLQKYLHFGFATKCVKTN